VNTPSSGFATFSHEYAGKAVCHGLMILRPSPGTPVGVAPVTARYIGMEDNPGAPRPGNLGEDEE
jgi:hypothetical protein